MNEARREAYQNLIDSLVTCPSEQKIDILQANLELIDDGFAQYLREWATETLATLDAEQAYNRASILFGLAISFYNLRLGSQPSDLEVGIACLEIGLTVFTREYCSRKWAMFQGHLGFLYFYRIRGEKAENLELGIAAFKASLEIYTRQAFPFEWARSQNNLATAYLYRIRGEKAESLELAIVAFKASLEIFTREAFPDEQKIIQNKLKEAYQHKFSAQEVSYCPMLSSYPRADRSVYNPYAPSHLPIILFSLYEIVFTYFTNWKNFQLRQAYNTFNSAIETVESIRSNIVINSEAYRHELADKCKELYQEMVEVGLDMEKSTAALEYVECSKTRNLVELFHKAPSLPENLHRQPISFSEIPSLLAQTAREYVFKYLLVHYREQVCQRRLSDKSPNLPEDLQRQPIGFAEIRSLLAKNEAILEWYISLNYFKVFIITSDSIKPDVWKSSSQDLQALEKFQQEYIGDIKDEEKYDNWKNKLDSRLKKLAQILHIDEIISRLPENCQKLILVPFRYLHLFPLHALISSRQKADTTVETGCLLELFPGGVRYTPSCQLLQLSQRVNLTAEDASSSRFFAIQNPTEDLDFTDIEVEAIAKSFNPAEVLSRQNASKAGLLQQIASLQNADIAHFSCHGFFDFINPEKSALILAGAKITPLNPPLVRGETRKNFPLLRGETRKNFPLLSEKTGGNETPPLSKGGLGGVPSEEKRYIRSRRGETFDIAECLTLTEIFDLQLSKCRLVALSACETGLTGATDKTDEYIGLTSGFFYAGATSVLSTLWAVNDVSTAILMIKFYELFRSKSRPAVSVALRESQLWLRDARVQDLVDWVAGSELIPDERKEGMQDYIAWGEEPENKPYQSPHFWAAFCAVGQ